MTAMRMTDIRTDAATGALPPEVVDAVLGRLGLTQRPAKTVEGLRELYVAWCRGVLNDSVQKRLHLGRNRPGPLPIGTPSSFFEAFLDQGTGGTCWSHAIGLYSLLDALGFEVRGAAGSMLGLTPPGNGPSHGTVIATIDNQDYLVDGAMFIEDVPALVDGEGGEAGPAPFTVRIDPNDLGLWDITFRMAHSDKPITCRLEVDGVGLEYYEERWEHSRQHSFFNSSLFVRRNLPGNRALTYGRGKTLELQPDGTVVVTIVESAAERRSLLRDTFGLSEEVIDLIPPDDEGKALF